MKVFRSTALTIALGLIFQPAAAQSGNPGPDFESEADIVIELRASRDPATGEIIFTGPGDAEEFSEMMASPTLENNTSQPERAFAKLNPDGKIDAIYSKEYLEAAGKGLDALEPGAALQVVNFFNRKAPTAEEIRRVVLEGVASAFEEVCTTNPNMDKLIVAADMGVDFGFKGSILVCTEWRPSRDCS